LQYSRKVAELAEKVILICRIRALLGNSNRSS
jgi:hypothetical protein